MRPAHPPVRIYFSPVRIYFSRRFGYDSARARAALTATGNKSVELAVDWLNANQVGHRTRRVYLSAFCRVRGTERKPSAEWRGAHQAKDVNTPAAGGGGAAGSFSTTSTLPSGGVSSGGDINTNGSDGGVRDGSTSSDGGDGGNGANVQLITDGDAASITTLGTITADAPVRPIIYVPSTEVPAPRDANGKLGVANRKLVIPSPRDPELGSADTRPHLSACSCLPYIAEPLDLVSFSF